MAYSALRLPVEIDLVEEVGVTAHVDAVPQRGLVPHGAAPGAARLAGAHQYLDVVELVEMRGTAKIVSSGKSSMFLLLRPLPQPQPRPRWRREQEGMPAAAFNLA